MGRHIMPMCKIKAIRNIHNKQYARKLVVITHNNYNNNLYKMDIFKFNKINSNLNKYIY